MKRLFFGAIILVLALWLHPFVSIAVAIFFGFSLSRPYYEMIVLGVLLDSVYQSIIIVTSWLSLPLYTLVSIGAFVAVTLIKKRMNIYA